MTEIESDPWLMLGDCLERMKDIPDGSVDMVMADLPYGTTACKWDSVIPFEPLWREYRRVCKKNAAIVLTASQPFTSALVMSNVGDFRHEWIWEKTIAANYGTMKFAPAKRHESVLVFGRESPRYTPIMDDGLPYTDKARSRGNKLTEKTLDFKAPINNPGVRYPSSVRKIPNPNNGSMHPTQKPVALMEYLIRTYTHEGETVLDNTMGSGTTGVACKNTGRRFIGIERDEEYFKIARHRIQGAVI